MTDKNIVGIRPDVKVKDEDEQLEPIPEVVEFLQDLLKHAEKGYITEIAIAAIYVDGRTHLETWAGLRENGALMKGTIMTLLQEYSKCDDEEEGWEYEWD